MNKFFAKIVSLVSISIFVSVGFVGVASAQNELLFGQNHFYTVIFHDDGEAITYVKMAITNPTEKSLTEFSFEMPRVSPSEIVMYQMKLPQECVRYNYNDPARPCLEYRDPDYRYSNRQAEYQKIQYTKSGNLYHLTLPTQVEPYKSTAIVVAYAAKGYVDESLGLYKFDFETLKVPSRIQKIRVVVDVDGNLLMKRKKTVC